MKKTRSILDKDTLKELPEQYKDKLDSEFINYVVDYYLLRGRQLGLLDRTDKEATYRKTKRWLQKAYPDDWKFHWRILRRDMAESLRPYKRFEELKFRKEGIDIDRIHKIFRPKQRGRPKLDNLFNAILILLGYFEDKLGGPNWKLMSEIFRPHYRYEYDSLGNLWFYMKKNYLDKAGIKINRIKYVRDIYNAYLETKSRMDNE